MTLIEQPNLVSTASFTVTQFGILLGGVLHVDSNDQLLDTEGVGEQGVLSGLSVLGNTSLELTGSGGDDEHTAVSLAGASDHVLDEVTMAGGVDDGDVVLGGLELPECDINGDTTLTLGLQLVHDPGILEGALNTNVIQF